MRSLRVIAHNIRSTHNVGSLLRTAEGLGVEKVYLTGYTPYPSKQHDDRMPHIARKVHKQIVKTALGAEELVAFEQNSSIEAVIKDLKKHGFRIVALEQTKQAKSLLDFKPSGKVALLVGREVEGIESDVLLLCDEEVQIPMFGKKESFNVVQTAAMALFYCRFF